MAPKLSVVVRKEGLVAGLLLLLALLVCVGLYRSQARSRLQLQTLEQQWLRVQDMAAQAEALRATLPAQRPDSAAQLKEQVAVLGDQASLHLVDHEALLTLRHAPGAEVAAVLGRLRQTSRIAFVRSDLRLEQGQVSGTLTLRLLATQ